MTLRFLVLTSALLALAACGKKPADEPADEPADTPAVAETAAPAQAASAALPRSLSADGAKVFFITPANGATVTNPVSIVFGIEGMDVVKAGNSQANSGHHHLLIDTDVPDLGLPIPADTSHVHFGDGSTVAEITLPSGEHSLQMLLGDHLHIPHNPPLVSEPITITVE